MFDKLKRRLNELYTQFADDDFVELAKILAETEAEIIKECEKIVTLKCDAKINCKECAKRSVCKVTMAQRYDDMNCFVCSPKKNCPTICPKYKGGITNGI